MIIHKPRERYRQCPDCETYCDCVLHVTPATPEWLREHDEAEWFKRGFDDALAWLVAIVAMAEEIRRRHLDADVQRALDACDLADTLPRPKRRAR